MQWNQRVISSVSNWPGTAVLCIGDVMLDRFIYGSAGRISPEAPIPVLLVEREEVMPGGAGNVVRNMAALGARVWFAGVTGEDADGESLTSLLSGLPGCTVHMVRDKSRRTSGKTRYLAQSQQLLRVDAESTAPVSEEVLGNLLDFVRETLPKVNLAILSDYAKGVLSEGHARRFIELCQEAGKPVFVDPKGTDFARYRGAALIKPNLKELAEAARREVSDSAAVEAAAKAVIASTGIGAVLATRGAAGMMLVREDAASESFRSMAREVFDVSGAGDTVAAVLAVGSAAGLELGDAVRIACVAAGIVVGKIGTATVTGEELLREVEAVRHPAADVRIFTEADVLERARAWRSAGLTVGFVCGMFQSLGAAQMAELGAAKDRCDRLIVGVSQTGSSDVHAVLASLASVDLVVALESDDAIGFSERLRDHQI